jgi:diguanylate cyclase
MTDSAAPSPAQLAKQALKRLTQNKLEPTPQQFALAYEAEQKAAGLPIEPSTPMAAPQTSPPPAADTLPWADLVSKLTRGLETSHRSWTAARKKDSLQRVLQGSRQNNQRLHERLNQLILSWDTHQEDAVGVEVTETAVDAPATATQAVSPAKTSALPMTSAPDTWVSALLLQTVDTALPDSDPTALDARQHLHLQVDNTWASLQGSTSDGQLPAIKDALAEACAQSKRAIEHRSHFTDQLMALCNTLTEGMLDMVEDDSWVQGQCEAVRSELAQGLNYRGARRIQQLVEDARIKQQSLQQERQSARQALKNLIHQMLQELAQLDETTGRFQDKLTVYADTIGQADSLESLAGVVRDMVQDSRTVHDVVSQTQARLQSEHARASELTDRVQQLEQEIRKLSDEVSTDPLTQIANRRGLMQTFDHKRAETQAAGKPLSIGLLDVDNFKKLNDTLGHQTGDEALKFLARRVSECLRPNDAVARYGGEEFVVLLPETDAHEGEQILTRLQRQLSAECFEHDDQRVFITFSAGVTTHRAGEPIEAALDRADMALYEAKRTGKNRTCLA